ncbi:MAG TPA: peptidoglycan-binding protein, partial [Stellaceae bacterium]|nr:peptidoglycan-binding protein [Stellaceae bacterium]
PLWGAHDLETTAVITAFQRHFRPERCDGRADPETARRIAAVAALARADVPLRPAGRRG